MMFREAKLVALAVFHTFLLAICAANGNQTCRPSSCGDIQNISNPFRLKGDPSGCGDPDYELVCENNRTMVNLEYVGKFYVADINYHCSTIRIVDPGVEKGNCFSTPLNSFSGSIFDFFETAYYWNLNEETNIAVLMYCDQPISDGNYIPITPCDRSNLTSSSSQAYVYALVGRKSMGVGDIKYSCTILRTIATRFLKPGNLSMSDLQGVLLLGLDLSFLRFRCKSECDVKGLSCDPYSTKNTVKCGYSLNWFSECLQYLRDVISDWDTFSIKGLREYYYYYNYGSAVLVGWLMRYIAMIIIIGRTALGILCLLVYLIYKFNGDTYH